MKLKLVFTFVIIIILKSCVYNIEEELYPDVDCNTSNVKYSTSVVPILTDNCYVCHAEAANVGGVNFESHEKLKIYVDNGSLLGAITHSPNYSAMPQGSGQLDNCLIETIKEWIESGALNN